MKTADFPLNETETLVNIILIYTDKFTILKILAIIIILRI